MAKFLTPDLLKLVLPIVIPFAKELAAKTETKLDDRLVAALETAISNPVIFALLLSLLTDAPAPVVSAEDAETAVTLTENADTVKALFAVVA
jgi:predicted permease